MNDISTNIYRTVSPLMKFVDLQFQVSILKGNITNDILILKGERCSSVITWNGKSCASTDIRGSCIEVKKALYILSALPVADCVTAGFSYHIQVPL